MQHVCSMQAGILLPFSVTSICGKAIPLGNKLIILFYSPLSIITNKTASLNKRHLNIDLSPIQVNEYLNLSFQFNSLT